MPFHSVLTLLQRDAALLVAVHSDGMLMTQRPGGKPLSPTATAAAAAPPWGPNQTPAMLAAASAAGLPHGMQAMAAASQLLAAVQGLGPGRALSSTGGAQGAADADAAAEPQDAVAAAMAALGGLRILLQGLGVPEVPSQLVQLLCLQALRWLEHLLGK